MEMQAEAQETQAAGGTGDERPSLFGSWLASLLVLLCEAAGAYLLFTRTASLSGWGLRAVLLSLVTGWLAYLYIAFGLPGTQGLQLGVILLIVFLAGAVGLIATLIWRWWLLLSQNTD